MAEACSGTNSLLAFAAYLECAAYFAVNDCRLCGGAFAWR